MVANILGPSSTSGRPPDPARFNNWREYAVALSAFTADQSRASESVQPQAVQLIHVDTVGQLARVVTDGLLVYDPVRRGIMVSIDGEWLPLYAGVAYGGMRSGVAPAAAANITPTWRTVEAYTEMLPTQDMVFDPVTNTFAFERPGLYLVILQISIEHNNSGQARELDVRVRNTITNATTRGVRVPTGAGDRTTAYTQSIQVLLEDATLNQPFLVEIAAPIGDYTNVLYRGVSVQAARINYAF